MAWRALLGGDAGADRLRTESAVRRSSAIVVERCETPDATSGVDVCRGRLHDQATGCRTWDAYAALAEKHNGVWGGCWCTYFHRVPGEKGHGVPTEVRAAGEPGEDGALLTRRWKEHLVRTGHAHAAVVFDGNTAIAWCQYGTPDELPNIYHRKEHDAQPEEPPARYRITCFFVDRDYRRNQWPGSHCKARLISSRRPVVASSNPSPTTPTARRPRPPSCTTSPAACSSGPGSRFERTLGKTRP